MRDANKDRSEKRKAYRQANKDKFAKKQKAYYQANKAKIVEKSKAYYQANKEKIVEKQKAYQQANKAKIAEYKKAYYQANKTKIAEKRKAYRQAETTTKDYTGSQRKEFHQMSKSNIMLPIEHDGEYCGKCWFLKDSFNVCYRCKAFDNTDLWSCRDKVKRCDECIRQAVPIEEEEWLEDL